MTPTNEDLLALAKIICAAMNGPSEYGWDDQSDLYRSRCLDAARCDLVAERKSTQLCASHDCGRPAMVRFESGGVGSTYCMECYLKIQELFDRTPDARVAVFPIYDIAGCHHIRDAERQGDQSAPLVDYGDAVAANDRLTESARKGLAAKIAASEPPAHDHQRDLVTAADPRIADYERAYQYALHLADTLRERHYPANTGWRPFGNLLGLLTQIDNMIAGFGPAQAIRDKALEDAALECDRLSSEQRMYLFSDPGMFGGQWIRVAGLCATAIRAMKGTTE